MPTSSLREIMRARPALGVTSMVASSDVIEIFGRSGWDFVVIDTEHGPKSPKEVLEEVRTTEAMGIVSLVRVSSNDPILIMKALDAGAQGVVVPHITCREEAKEAVRATRYPPEGDRGACFAARCTGYGALPWKAFHDASNRDVVVVLLVEDKATAAAIDDILSVKGIDVVWVGSGDLSASMGHAGSPLHEEVTAVRDHVIDRCRERGVFAGVSFYEEEDLRACVKRGARYLLCGSEASIFYAASRKRRDSLWELLDL